MRESVKIVGRSTGWIAGTWKNCCLVVYPGATTDEALDTVERTVNALAESHPNGIGMSITAEAQAPAPDGPRRERIARMLDDNPKILAASVVFEGRGLRFAGVRSILTVISLLARRSVPTHYGATVMEGSTWLAPLASAAVPGGWTAAELAAAIEELRSTPA